MPGAPTGLTATGGNAQVALAWTAPASNGGSADPRLHGHGGPGRCDLHGRDHGLHDRRADQRHAYSFTVTARNAVGSGSASNDRQRHAGTVPGAPNLTAATAGNAQVALAWTAPASNGGSAITGYTATASPGGARRCTDARRRPAARSAA